MHKKARIAVECSKPDDGQVAPFAVYFPSGGSASEASTSGQHQIDLYSKTTTTTSASTHENILILQKVGFRGFSCHFAHVACGTQQGLQGEGPDISRSNGLPDLMTPRITEQ